MAGSDENTPRLIDYVFEEIDVPVTLISVNTASVGIFMRLRKHKNSRKRTLHSGTVILLFVVRRPQNTCQQYMSLSHMASKDISARFPFFRLNNRHFKMRGQFFQVILILYADLTQPGNSFSANFTSITINSHEERGRFI